MPSESDGATVEVKKDPLPRLITVPRLVEKAHGRSIVSDPIRSMPEWHAKFPQLS